MGSAPLSSRISVGVLRRILDLGSTALRHQLRGTSTEVIELIPPYVQTHLMGEHQAADPRAMPLDEFIAEVMQILTTQPYVTEVVVERCKPLRYAAEDHNFEGML